MNKKIKLEKFNHYLQEKLKNPEFNKNYEIEKAKVVVAQISQQFISQIESGQETNLTLDTLFKLAKSLGRNINISFPKSHSKNPVFKIA